MADFFVPLEEAAIRKRPRVDGLFSPVASAQESALYRLFCEGGHWHPLPKETGERRTAMAVDGGLRTLELSNGGTLIVAQALLVGEDIEDVDVDVEILRGTVPPKTVDRFADLFRQKLEVRLAADHMTDPNQSSIMYLDGALYGGIPHLYPMDADGFEEPTHTLVEDYARLFSACGPNRLLISVAKSSRDSLLVELLQEEAGVSEGEIARLPDSELIHRWTDHQAGFSTPILLGSRSFSGGSPAKLLEKGNPVSQMPAILSFFVRPVDFAPALRVDVPGACIGRAERISDLEAALVQPEEVEMIVAALGADYGGERVYNPLLYAADQRVALHTDRFYGLYLPILEAVWSVKLEATLSQSRFM